jgi:hypothetical protein
MANNMVCLVKIHTIEDRIYMSSFKCETTKRSKTIIVVVFERSQYYYILNFVVTPRNLIKLRGVTTKYKIYF